MNSKTSVLIFTIMCLAYFSSDFSQRIWLDSGMNSEAIHHINKDESLLSITKLNDNYLAQILSNLESYDVTLFEVKEAIKIKETKGMSLTEQANQQGELDRVFTGDIELTLKGIFNKDISYVLLQERNIKTSDISVKQVKKGESIHGYLLSQISQKSTQLTVDERVIELMLYQIKPITQASIN